MKYCLDVEALREQALIFTTGEISTEETIPQGIDRTYTKLTEPECMVKSLIAQNKTILEGLKRITDS